MTSKDGGPAYPSEQSLTNGKFNGPSPGMTLHQWYAGQAMAAIITAAYSNVWAQENINDAAKKCDLNFYDTISEYATAHADSMLAHEEQDKEQPQ